MEKQNEKRKNAIKENVAIQKRLMDFLNSPTANEPLEYTKPEEEEQTKVEIQKRPLSVANSEKEKGSRKPVDAKHLTIETPREANAQMTQLDLGTGRKAPETPSPTKSQRIKIAQTDRKTTDRTDLPTDATRAIKLLAKKAS